MKDERYSVHSRRSARFDPRGSRGEFKLSAKLRARMKRLEEWRIHPSSIKFPEDARESHGGHAIVSKAFLLGSDSEGDQQEKSYNRKKVLQLCRQSPESDDHIRGTADHRRDTEGELDSEEEDDEEEHGSDSDERWWGEFVAVKKSRMADNKNSERVLGLALRETEFLVELSHPNIVKLKGFVEDLSKDMIWLVFRWEENGNLKDFVASRDWEIPERISLIGDVARGLEYLHSQEPPICHGDLKSLNVLVNSENLAVITDFGSARRLTEHDLERQPGPVQNQQQPVQATFSTLSKTITLTGNVYTLRWAAPELLNDDQLSLWSDIWALGWIAYEVLTDSIPFQDVLADTVVIERVIRGDLPSMKKHARVSLFERLCSLMTECWNTDPWERPTAEKCLEVIEDMPMVVPDKTYSQDSTLSGASSANALLEWAQTSDDFRAAAGYAIEAQEIYARNGDREGEACALRCFIDWMECLGRGSGLIPLYSKLHQIETDIGNMEGKADALTSLALLHLGDKKDRQRSEAIKLFSELLQLCTDIGDRTGQASALSGLANAHQLRKEYSEAIKLYSEALEIRPDPSDTRRRVHCIWSLARVHRLRNEYSEAIAHYSEVLQICTDAGDRRSIASALCGLADVHRLQKKYSEAHKLYFEALQIHVDISDTEREGRFPWLYDRAEIRGGKRQAFILSSEADRCREHEQYSKAIPLYSEALQIRTDIGARQSSAGELWGLAEVHRIRNKYSEAIPLYSEVLQICTDGGSRIGQAFALSALADMHRRRDEYSEAIALYSEFLQVNTNTRNTKDLLRKCSALCGLGDVYRRLDEYSEAIKLYSKALQICTNIHDRRGKASALCGLADVYRLQKKYGEANKLYFKALQIRTDISKEPTKCDRHEKTEAKCTASSLWGLADMHRRRDEYSEAIKLYSKALQICTDIHDRRGKASALCGLADVHRLQKKYSKAIKLYSKVLKICPDISNMGEFAVVKDDFNIFEDSDEMLQVPTDIGDGQCRASALWGLADVHRIRNEYSEATALYSEALQIRTDIGDRHGMAEAQWGLDEVRRAQNE